MRSLADPEIVDREEVAKRASKKLPSPSLFGKPNGEEGWTTQKLQDLQRFMCFHCSAHDDDKQPTPVVLLDPILAQVSHDCEHATPSDADCKFAALVASSMSGTFADGDHRMRKFWGLLDEQFNEIFSVQSTVGLRVMALSCTLGVYWSTLKSRMRLVLVVELNMCKMLCMLLRMPCRLTRSDAYLSAQLCL